MALDEYRVNYEELDIFKNRITREELEKILLYSSVDEIFSWSSPSARKYKPDRYKLEDSELISLMVKEPRLIRRPILLGHDRVIVGFKNKSYEFLQD
ncbi:hypothetical protein M1N55_03095 [Dehalococcoidia bacterium]|nr:hypothetical protein [Dehalococcoidia bacterium]